MPNIRESGRRSRLPPSPKIGVMARMTLFHPSRPLSLRAGNGSSCPIPVVRGIGRNDKGHGETVLTANFRAGGRRRLSNVAEAMHGVAGWIT